MVDDDPLIREVIVAIVGDAGYEVVEAKDGKEGVEAFRRDEVDLVILDVQMPKKDGFTVLVELKHDPETASIPVVMLTGVAEATGVRFSKSDVGDYIGAEPDAYVEKPVEPAALSEVVSRLLGA